MAGKRKKRTAQTAPEDGLEGGPLAPRAEPRSRSERTTLKTTARIVLALGLAVGVIGGVVWLGREAGSDVAGRARYAVRVADISCELPPGGDRATFLTEVRYLGGLP